MLRTPQALIPYMLALACIAAGGLWHISEGVPRAGRVLARGIAQVGGPFALTDQEGKSRTDADFRGRWVWVYFGYTHCPDVCPTTLSLMSEVLKQLGARGQTIAPIFITLDPARDTPKILKSYLASFGPHFVGLTGSEKAISVVTKEFRVYRVKRPLPGGGYSIDHSSVICLMGPDGKFVTAYDETATPQAITSDLRKRLSE